MRLLRRTLLGGFLAAPTIARAQEPLGGLSDLARRATIYLFPVYEMYRARWHSTADPANPFRERLNRFRHLASPSDHTTRGITMPNSDTLYSVAWLDLSLEPMFLTVPPVGDLYYSYAFVDLFTNNIAYASHRLHGGRPPEHMVVGPSWKGDAPLEVQLVRSPTNSVLLLGRLLVDGPEELERMRILQRRVLLETPDARNERRILESGELMRHRLVPPPEPSADWPPPNPGDPFDLLEAGARALGESPLPDRDRAMLDTLAPLRLRPGRKFDVRGFTEAERTAILAGIEQGHREIRQAAHRPRRTIDGWTYSRGNLGNFGDDYLYRAATAVNGLGALEAAEAIYLSCNTDSDGQALNGTRRYEITFPADGTPPVQAFWSLAMYEVATDGRAIFTDNPIGRYAIGGLKRDLRFAADGSLTLYLQRGMPDDERMDNWLPAPAGPMRLVLRGYEPSAALLDGSYRMPPVRRVD